MIGRLATSLYVIGNFGEMFVVGESFGQTEKSIVDFAVSMSWLESISWMMRVSQVETAASCSRSGRISNTEDLNESFAFGNCKDLFEVGEYSKQSKFSTHWR